MISFFDLICVLILFGFFWFGFWYGLIYSIGAIFGIMAGAFAAGHYYLIIARWFSDNPGNFLKVIVFILVFVIVNKIVGFLFWFADKIFNIISVIPFLKTINRITGGVLGLFEGAITLGVVIYIYVKYPFSDWITEQLARSLLTPWLLRAVVFVKPFWPEILKQLKNFIF